MRPLNLSARHAEDYYYEKDPIFKSNSKWFGDLSEKFKLEKGEIKTSDFLNFLGGNDNRGKKIVGDGVNGEHKGCTDIPFSAPKSVSILALHCGDDRLIHAHDRAVENVINYIEKKYLYARRTTKGKTESFKTINGLFATFKHSTSRSNDPQLHTHTLIMNVTKTDRGYRATHNDKIFDDQKFFTTLYNNYLAKEVVDLGFSIKSKGDGFFEILGVKDKWIETFSKRKQQIDDKFEEIESKISNDKINKSVLRNKIVIESRAEKNTEISHDELRKTWQNEVDKEIILKNIKQYLHKKNDEKLSPIDHIKIACDAIHENESCFDKAAILDFSMRLSLGQHTIDDFEKSFKQLMFDKYILLNSTMMEKGGTLKEEYTTTKMKKIENDIIQKFQRGKDSIESYLDKKDLKSYIEKQYSFFKEGQKQVVESILTSTNRFSIIQGDAGTGKTTCLKAANNFIKKNKMDVELIGLSYTGKAAMEMFEKADIQSETLHSFLKKRTTKEEGKKQIWLIDEASMVGSIQLHELFEKAEEHNAQVFLIGDGKQLQSIGAGKIFQDIQNYEDGSYIKMEDVLRQKMDYTKNLVHFIKSYQDGVDKDGIDKAFSLMEKNNSIQKMKSEGEGIKAVTTHYISNLSQDQECLIITPANKDRVSINEEIHQTLKAEKKEQSITIRTPISMKGTKKYFATNYRLGQGGFISESSIKDLKVGKGIKVLDVDPHENRLKIRQSGKDFDVSLKDGLVSLSMYQEESRNFYEGDKIVMLKNDRLLNVGNGQTGEIKSLKNDMMTVKIDRGGEVSFDVKNYPYFDLGYAVTVHKSQGQDAKSVIYYGESKHPGSRTESLYVGASRAEEEFTIYTADRNTQSLKNSFKRPQGKTSTLGKSAPKDIKSELDM